MEFSSFSGRITAVTGRPNVSAAPVLSTKFSDAGEIIQGYATRFNKPHMYKGRVEVFARGCFARSLVPGAPAVSLLVMHKESELLGTTADRLELMQDEHGLAFRFRVPDDHLAQETKAAVAARELSAMSVGYQTLAEEVKTIDGTEVHIIKDAALREISLCRIGAVPETHAAVTVTGEALPFNVAVKSGSILADGAFAKLMQSLDRLRDAAGS